MSRSLLAVSSLVLIMLLVGPAAVQAQTTWCVDDDAPAGGDGSPGQPFDTIQEGIDAAQGGDVVLVADGVYTGGGNKNIEFGGKAITVRSENGAATCVIDCEGSGRGFWFHQGEGLDSIVDGLLIRNGNVISGGPGDRDGGGIQCESSSPTIRRCIIAGNNAESRGGGLYCVGSNPLVIGCLIAGNWAHGNGGGICCEHQSNPLIANCTVVANIADAYGGAGIGCETESSPSIINCTVTWNTHLDVLDGAGIGCSEEASPIIKNCILWENWPTEIRVTSSTLQPEVTYSNVQRGWLGPGNMGVDPLFVDFAGPDYNPATWADNDYRLSPGSPCIDAGCNWGVPPDAADLDQDGDIDELTPLDLDGEGRFFDDLNTPDFGCGNAPIVDMGAYEFGETGPQPCFADFDSDGDVDLGDLAELLSHYGETSAACGGDLDCDGDVDLADLSALLAVYGNTCP